MLCQSAILSTISMRDIKENHTIFCLKPIVVSNSIVIVWTSFARMLD